MRQMTIPAVLPDAQWIDVLRRETEKAGRTKADIGRELGVSRSTISTIVAGKYPAKMSRMHRKLAASVMAKYASEVWCEPQHAGISKIRCNELSTAPMPMSDPSALRQWAACQSCPLRSPSEKEEGNAVRRHSANA